MARALRRLTTVWALKNNTPYAAERTWLRNRDGNHLWLVAVKATFLVAEDGTLRLADEQPPPRRDGEYFGQPGASSLKHEADLVHPKHPLSPSRTLR